MNGFLSDLSIKYKLLSNTSVLLAMIMVISVYVLWMMKSIGDELDNIVEKYNPMTSIVTKLTEHQLEQIQQIERAVRYGIQQQHDASASDRFNKSTKKFDQYGAWINKEIQAIENQTEKALSESSDKIELEEFRTISLKLEKIKRQHQSFEEHAHNLINLLSRGEVREVEVIAQQMEEEEDQLTADSEAFLAEIERFTENASNRVAEHEHSALNIVVLLVVGSFVIGISASWILSANIVKRMRKTADELEIIASGDLSLETEVNGQDEIGNLQQAMAKMRNHLHDLVLNISDTTEQLSTAAEELSVVTVQTSSNIHKQQVETDQIATAMNQMTSTVREVESNIENTSKAASEAAVETENGHAVVKNAVESAHQLGEQVEQNAEAITEVEKNSHNINTVLEVIKGIAEQTNLLALNAAIEAARAGEQGRGFAVVADEVRTLAGRTQEATGEINQIIETLQDNSKSAVHSMEESRQQVKYVVEQAEKAHSALSAISNAVSDIDQMSSQIATAAKEQSTVTEEMSCHIVHINDMASQNATGADQTSAAGGELSRMASNLKGLVKQFNV